MNILARNSFSDLDTLFSTLSARPTRSLASKVPATSYQNKSPKTDINSTADGYQLIAELPGINKEDISVSIDDNTLLIETKQKPSKSTDDISNIRNERFSGNYSRKFTLDETIDQKSISAEFSNGLLILSLPKLKEVVQEPQQIKIH